MSAAGAEEEGEHELETSEALYKDSLTTTLGVRAEDSVFAESIRAVLLAEKVSVIRTIL